MEYSNHIKSMCPIAKGAKHENAPIPEEGKWVHAKQITDISGLTHDVCPSARRVQAYLKHQKRRH